VTVVVVKDKRISSRIGGEVFGVGLEGGQNDQKRGKKQGPKKCFRGRQVGAFSVFWHGHTGGPFIFWRFWPFFTKFCRFRGWCNI